MSTHDNDLDVVVLGGGGHVGLPLSLAFAEAGLRVGIYDINQATLDRIAGGTMPFMENGADELLHEVLATGRLEFGSDASMIGRTDQLVVVIGTPVDEFLGPSMTIFEKAVDQIAPQPARWRARRVAEHRLPGHDRIRGTASGGPRLRRRRRLLSGADRRGPRPRGAALVAADRRGGHGRGGGSGGSPLRPPDREDDPDDLQGGRARQALHEHLALHEVRGREPVPDDRRPGWGGLHERPARDPRGLPPCRGPARPGLRRRPVPVQGHDAARGLHDATTSRWARRPCRSTRACPHTSCRRWNVATGASRARPSASWAWPSRANRTTPARR